MKNLVIISGAGISAESGVPTFRDSDGLWCNHRVEDVATYTAWEKNPKLVQDFYNERRKQVLSVEPNAAHFAITELQNHFNVQVITQNVDDLHERAGNTNVLHLHGNIRYAKSSNPDLAWAGMSATVFEEHYLILGDTINYPEDTAPDGFPLRPDIVWFGEAVPAIIDASEIVKTADIIIVVGTSLQVYPAASLVYDAKNWVPIYYIDPNPGDITIANEVNYIKEKASVGFDKIKETLISLK